MVRSVVLNLLNAALRIAAFCIALVAASHSSGSGRPPLVSMPEGFRLAIGIVSGLLIVSAVAMIDWVIDSFGDNEWKEIDAVATTLGNKQHTTRLNFFVARARLFGTGFLFLALSLASLSGILALFAGLSLSNSTASHICAWVAATTACSAVFLKLMTRRMAFSIWCTFIAVLTLAFILAWQL